MSLEKTKSSPLCLCGAYQEDRNKLFQVVHGGRTKNKRHKPEQKRICFIIRQNFFIIRMVQQWKIYQRGLATSIFGSFQDLTG